jgi:molybdopterin molybdotransferase
VVCVTGGVSVGPHDHVKPALAELGVEERFWGVRLQPGKPTWFGTTGDGRLVFGLPGNPVSAMVTFQLFALPAVRALQGADPEPRRARARLAEPLRRNPKRDQMVRVRLERTDDGLVARSTKAQQSHVLTSMLGADALARVPAGEGDVAAGDRIDIELL